MSFTLHHYYALHHDAMRV